MADHRASGEDRPGKALSGDSQKTGASQKTSGPGIDRRRALNLLLCGSTLGVAGLATVPLTGYLLPIPPSSEESTVAFDADLVGLWEARLLVVAGRPVLAVNAGEEFAAFSAVCTHLGCVVKWKKGRRQFFCPCHGARFDAQGRVLGGPARGPLPRLEVKRVADKVVVRFV